MLATEYICIDEQLPIERFTDDDIIATVQNDEEDEENKEKSNTTAYDFIKNSSNKCGQPNAICQ